MALGRYLRRGNTTETLAALQRFVDGMMEVALGAATGGGKDN